MTRTVNGPRQRSTLGNRGPDMPHINYEIPDDLHRALKIEAAKRGITLKALIIELLSLVDGIEGEGT